MRRIGGIEAQSNERAPYSDRAHTAEVDRWDISSSGGNEGKENESEAHADENQIIHVQRAVGRVRSRWDAL